MFRDREEAGKLLSELLKKYGVDKENTVILAIPRGGVPVAYEVS
ncbi:MAG TPA: phosphoribosyltransferase, partial [Sulfurihydrogenibium sp.]|nr:phosphoribosyltransferase [Sulfurihydrogenibium sp.]